MNFLEILKQMGALWIHDDNKRRPHALLSSGKHSNGFFNASLATSNPDVLHQLCKALLRQVDFSRQLPQMVVGSAMGAVTMAYEIARQLDGKTEAGFTEKVDQLMELKRFSIKRNHKVLVVEDVITTGGTTRKTIDAIERAGGALLPFILTLVNRSDSGQLDGYNIISLIQHHLPIWDADDCPLCRAGSKALRPKDNWDKLNASY
ncbi:MAG: phosphoribosyltransferase family protein [Patescibacteria group bacterium]|nr:phosphoribosyltransferase family protein [Patescibacteria group bacterium]